MAGGESDKNALTGAAIPFTDLLAILESRINYINRAAKDVGVCETIVQTLDARE